MSSSTAGTKDGPSRNRQRRRPRTRRPASIRARVLAIALTAIALLTAERAWHLLGEQHERISEAHNRVLDLTLRGAEAHQQAIVSARSLLQGLALRGPALMEDPEACRRFLDRTTEGIIGINQLFVADAGGDLRCTIDGDQPSMNLSDRSYFRDVVASSSFAVSDLVVGRRTGKPSIFAALPVIADDGDVTMVVGANIDLHWLSRLTNVSDVYHDAVALLVDNTGTIVADNAPVDDWHDLKVNGEPLITAMLGRSEGTIDAVGPDGQRRIFGFIRIDGSNTRLAVGIDERQLLASFYRDIWLTTALFSLMCLFSLMGSWFVGEHFIVEPLRQLADTISRFGRGEGNKRISDEVRIAEFAPLVSAFREMTDKLSDREHALRVANEQLSRIASLDPLTGVPNRRTFDVALINGWERARREEHGIALLMIDIDFFKLFNDRYGHLAGDTCLREVAQALTDSVRGSTDLLARYGGEEFVLILEDTDLATATDIAERMCRRVREIAIPHYAAPGGVVTLSIGLDARVPLPEEPSHRLLEAADQALYEAKHQGRDRVWIAAHGTFEQDNMVG